MTDLEKFMKQALKEAKKARQEDEVPIAAVIVLDGKIIARAHNTREKTKDATNHAEIICIKKACKKLNDFRLLNAEMYVTLEPCIMCFGAILNSRIKKVIIGADATKSGQISVEELNERSELNHKCVIVRNVLKEECSLLLSDYFSSRRGLK